MDRTNQCVTALGIQDVFGILLRGRFCLFLGTLQYCADSECKWKQDDICGRNLNVLLTLSSRCVIQKPLSEVCEA